MGAARLGERVDVADDDLELARGDGAEQVGDHRRDLVAARDQVHEPEADHGARVSQQVPGVDLVRLAGGDPEGDQAAERGQRPQAGLEGRRRRSSRARRRPRVAVVGLEDRRLQVLGARVDGRVGAEARRRARASPRSRRARSPGRRRAWRAARRASRCRRRRPGRRSSRPPGAARSGGRARARSGPGAAAPRPDRRRPRRGAGSASSRARPPSARSPRSPAAPPPGGRRRCVPETSPPGISGRVCSAR